MIDFKFRAWDEDAFMFVPTKLVFGTNGNKGTIVVWRDNIFGNLGSGIIALMQYTGLKDTNDKEIYEGDVVKAPTGSHPYRVIFLLGSFDINYPDCCVHCKSGNACHGSLYEYLAHYENVEVIGNIYENPELLKSG